jgi:hypothetical protein
VIPTVTTVTNQLSAATISIQVASDLAIAHGAGLWETATGFAVPGDEMTLTSAYDAAKTAATQTSVNNLQADATDIKTTTDKFVFTVVGQVDANALTVPAGATPPTVAEIVDGVWDELLSGHTVPGSAAVFLAAAGGAADPWLTALPGSYVPGSAGYIIGTSSGASVTVLPAVGISADRSPGITLNAFVGETITQSITLYETDGTTPIVLTGKTLAIVFETRQGLDVAVVANANITVSGASDNVVTFAYPSAATSAQRVLKFALRDAAAPKTVYIQGLLNVTRAPSVDT